MIYIFSFRVSYFSPIHVLIVFFKKFPDDITATVLIDRSKIIAKAYHVIESSYQSKK